MSIELLLLWLPSVGTLSPALHLAAKYKGRIPSDEKLTPETTLQILTGVCGSRLQAGCSGVLSFL